MEKPRTKQRRKQLETLISALDERLTAVEKSLGLSKAPVAQPLPISMQAPLSEQACKGKKAIEDYKDAHEHQYDGLLQGSSK